MIETLQLLFISMRPWALIQNLLVLVPFIFSPGHFSGLDFFKCLLALLVWGLLQGCAAIANDLLDTGRDSLHPLNRQRPIPSGRLSTNRAESALAILALGALVAGFVLNTYFGLTCLAFVILMMLYTLWLRHFPIFELLVLGIAMSLRVVAGYTLINMPISPWGVLPAFSLGFLLACAKRLHESYLLGKDAPQFRGVFDEYSRSLLQQLFGFAIFATAGTYTLSALLSAPAQIDHRPLWLTLPPVFYGLLRFWQKFLDAPAAMPPDEMPIRERSLQWALGVWLVFALIIT